MTKERVQIYRYGLYSYDMEFPENLANALSRFDPSLVVGWNNKFRRWDLWRISPWNGLTFVASFKRETLCSAERMLQCLHYGDAFENPDARPEQTEKDELDELARKEKVFHEDNKTIAREDYNYSRGTLTDGWHPGRERM